MPTIDITLSWPPQPPGKTLVLRIDFHGEAISSRGPYAMRDRKYWLDDLPFNGRAITRAQMLSQALRRIDGVGEITVEQYALIVRIAPTYLATEQARTRIIAKIKSEIVVALSVLTPWATHCSNQSSWSYHFGARLVQNGYGERNPVSSDSPHLTKLAQKIVRGREWKQSNLPIGDIWSHHLFVISARLVTPLELAQGQFALLANVDERPVKINWK